jgi:hypothetical protein
MPEDTGQPIEEQLRAYAQARREAAGEPLELHPVTRRSLQEEVARTCAGEQASALVRAPRWGALWLRLGFGAGLAAVAVLAILNWGPRDEVHQLAQVEPRGQAGATMFMTAPEESAVRELPTAPPPPLSRDDPDPRSQTLDVSAPAFESKAVADADVAETGRSAGATSTVRDMESARRLPLEPAAIGGAGVALKDAQGEPAAEAEALRKVAPPSGSGVALVFKSEDGMRAEAAAPPNRMEDERKMAMPPAEAQPKAATTPSVHLGAQLAAGQVKAKEAVALRFVQSRPYAQYRRNINSPAQPEVLTAFDIRRDGSRIVVTDADGSLYVGEVLERDETQEHRDAFPASRPPVARTETAQRLQTAPAPPQQLRSQPATLDAVPPPARGIQAVEAVFFRVRGTNQSLQKSVVIEGVLQLPQSSGNLPAAPILRVQGRATVGTNHEIPIDALPVRP